MYDHRGTRGPQPGKVIYEKRVATLVGWERKKREKEKKKQCSERDLFAVRMKLTAVTISSHDIIRDDSCGLHSLLNRSVKRIPAFSRLKSR